MNNRTFTQYANSFQATARLRLESIECLLKHLGNPQNDLKFIHVAGTNGKGSVCSFLQSIFSKAGYCTGKYTSPNLISVCERISVDGKLISDSDLNRLLKTVEKGVHLVADELGDSPTPFEIWTATAFLYFKEKNCDIVVLETGLGGTRDATNIIPPPLASVITRLDLDHTEYLGDTMQQIAAEKAGIIKTPVGKEHGLCITSPQSNEALDVLKSVCESKNNQLIISSVPTFCGFKDFHEIIDYTSTSTDVSMKDITCGICGFYQPENAALAIETALALGVSPKHIRDGIEAATNPARFEIIQTDPIVIYDGAHNKNGIKALISCLKRYFPDWNGATFITAFMGDKDIHGAFDELKSSGLLDASNVFAVQVKDNPRAAAAEDVCAVAEKCGIVASPFDSLKEAYHAALGNLKPVILCGSLYLYKDFYDILKQE